MADKQYYVRVRGRILGPFDLVQLRRQRDRGQLSGFHELSVDRVQWVPASTVAGLFPEEEPRAVGLPAAGGAITPVAPAGYRQAQAPAAAEEPPEEPIWHYMSGRGEQLGPVTRGQLVGLLKQGTINRATLVWGPSLSGWLPLESVPELRDGLARSPRKALGPLFRNRWAAPVAIAAGGGALFLVLVLGLGVYLFTREPAHLSAEQISTRYKERVYRIETEDGTGSGILIANTRTRGLIATNCHVYNEDLVVKPDKKAFRRIMPENSLEKNEFAVVKHPSEISGKKARWAAIHRDNDLALLVLDMEGEGITPGAVPVIRTRSLHDGEEAVALGYPLGMDYKVSPGAISGTNGEEGAVWTTCPINPGNSGGPLFLERRALLAALNTFKRNQVITVVDSHGKVLGHRAKDTQNLNGAEPAEEIVLPLQNGRTEKWVWAPDLKETVLELVKLVPVRD